MRTILLLVAAAAAFGLAPLLARLGPAVGPAAAIALAILLACAASGAFSPLAVTAGAAGAFASGVLDGASAAVAGACLVGFAFAERTTRVRTPAARAAHVTVALVGGALAGSLSWAYAAASAPIRAVAVLVAAVLVALPLLVDADDPIAHALAAGARKLEGAVARALLEGAELRRQVGALDVERDARRSMARTWPALVRLAEARVRLARAPRGGASVREDAPGSRSAADAVVEMLDRKVEEHVAALVRAYAAADTARAAELGLDDADARSVDAVGETLEDVSRAIVEVKG